jgi:hypothetical protein
MRRVLRSAFDPVVIDLTGSAKEIDSTLCAGGTIHQSTRSPCNPQARENEELGHARE